MDFDFLERYVSLPNALVSLAAVCREAMPLNEDTGLTLGGKYVE